jgi:hypothetical protein
MRPSNIFKLGRDPAYSTRETSELKSVEIADDNSSCGDFGIRISHPPLPDCSLSPTFPIDDSYLKISGKAAARDRFQPYQTPTSSHYRANCL